MKYPLTTMVVLLTILPIVASAQTGPQEGKQIFVQMCAGYHGCRGNGGEGRQGGFNPHIATLADKGCMSQVPAEYLILIVKQGARTWERSQPCPRGSTG